MKDAREYLEQAYRIDKRINCKIEQINSLHMLATKTNALVSNMPGSPNKNITRMENTLVKIVSLENEINDDIDGLIDLKMDIQHAINSIDNLEYRLILEQRYLNYLTWEQIAMDLGYTVRTMYRIRDKALECMKLPGKVV